MATTRAVQLIAKIDSNVDEWYADRIDYTTFTERQRATWDQIKADAAVNEAVLETMRKRIGR